MGLLVLKHKKPKLYFSHLYRIRLFQVIRCLDSQRIQTTFIRLLWVNSFHINVQMMSVSSVNHQIEQC